MDEGEKLFEKMRRSAYGWKERDVETLYTSFGFVISEATRHRKYWHPKHPELYALVPRHRQVKAPYIKTALRLITRLKEIEANDEK